jgi:hypothetical protein
MKQKVYPDPYGIQTWDTSTYGEVYIHILNSVQYESVTAQPPPASPVSAKAYTEYGLPWFELYDEASADLPAVGKLGEVKSIQEMEGETGEEEEPVDIDPGQILKVDPSQSNRAQRK